MIARNRHELARFFQDRMTGNHHGPLGGHEGDNRQALIKTYLIDAIGTVDFGEDEGPGFVPHLIRIVAGSALDARLSCEVHAADEPDLATIHGRRRGRKDVFLYVDCADPRYWIVHTLASSGTADWIVGRLVEAGTLIDRVLIPVQLLDKIGGLGTRIGLGLDFDRRIFPYTRCDGDQTPADFLKMQLWSGQAQRVLDSMRKDDAFRDHTTLSRVQIECRPDARDPAKFSLEDIRLDGKVTARGSWYQGHATLVSTLRAAHRREVAKLESECSTGSTSTADVLMGHALAIDTNRPIEDLGVFSRTVFSGAMPFRLLGVPRAAGSNLIAVRALDLRLGGRLDMEVTPEFIRIYLPPGGSGSTVLRFYANLQLHHDAGVRLLDMDEKDVFET